MDKNKRLTLNNCKENNCENKVDIFYYCDDHFKTEEEGNE